MRLTLTGSERISKSEATGDRLKEAQHINKSLSALGDVMAALGAKKPPYDDLAPMIRRLRDAYGSKRLMWATDCPYQLDKGPAGEAHSYAASLELVRDRLDFLSREERLDILRNTARRVFFDGGS